MKKRPLHVEEGYLTLEERLINYLQENIMKLRLYSYCDSTGNRGYHGCRDVVVDETDSDDTDDDDDDDDVND